MKDRNEYYLDWDHSSYCNNEMQKKYENIKDIDDEINNYKNMRIELKKFLDSYPTITYSDFIQKAYEIYYRSHCTFTIEKYTFKNIYYTWKKNSLSFSKFFALENNKTKNNEDYLRDYSFMTLYNKSGKIPIYSRTHDICIKLFFKINKSCSPYLY